MTLLRLLSRFIVFTTLAALGLDALLLVVALNPDLAAHLPKPPSLDGNPKDWWPLAGWLVGFWLFMWLISRNRQYASSTPANKRTSVTSPYARAIPHHEDLVDMLAGVPGAGAREMASRLRAGPHATVEEREHAALEAEQWAAGAAAEERAGRLLQALGPDWTVLHDITVHHRGWNLDHVAIGPQGVFVINTKTTTRTDSPTIVADADRVVVHGWHTDYLAKSRKEAFRTSVTLFGRRDSPLVTPVLLFVNTPSVEFRSPPGDVWIAEAHNIVPALTSGPVRMTPKQYGRVVGKARYQQTWIDGWERSQALTRSTARAARRASARSAPTNHAH